MYFTVSFVNWSHDLLCLSVVFFGIPDAQLKWHLPWLFSILFAQSLLLTSLGYDNTSYLCFLLYLCCVSNAKNTEHYLQLVNMEMSQLYFQNGLKAKNDRSLKWFDFYLKNEKSCRGAWFIKICSTMQAWFWHPADAAQINCCVLL